MAALEINSFTISGKDAQAIANDLTEITTHVVYDSDPPAGWMIVAKGPLGSMVVCPKPCGGQVKRQST
jgi:hypothetical protein